ncbi:MAG: bacillithiol biosynthesis cysteine-adding enzyme BshC [Salibacteraceae bacterium]
MAARLLDTYAAPVSPLVADYLSEKETLKPFYQFSPTMQGLKKAAENRHFKKEHRAILVERLIAQANSVEECAQPILDNIKRLEEESVYTVTTGHQLCLYGGPMFFFYKILSAINLVERLSKEGVSAVPVYWMASEDHDFEEINHLFLEQKKIAWNAQQSGAVGPMHLNGIEEVQRVIQEYFKDDHRYGEVLKRLENIFSSERTLSSSIRELVQWVFGDYGVVVIDGDDPVLKSLFAPYVEMELKGQFSNKSVSQFTDDLESLGFSGQVSGRDINLFLLDDGYRERITLTDDGYATADGEHNYSSEELLKLLEKSPERFSPNVILRPLYQEVILPNIAYIGGPGEASYWLQLKGVFDHVEVAMPVVLLRDMFLISNDAVEKKRQQLNIDYKALKQNSDDLLTELVRNEGSHEYIADKALDALDETLSTMIDEIAQFDKGLVESANAERTRILNRIQVLRKKLLRSDKTQNAIIKQRLEYILNWSYPHADPQERVHNWMVHFHDPKAVNALLEYCDPLSAQVKVVIND